MFHNLSEQLVPVLDCPPAEKFSLITNRNFPCFHSGLLSLIQTPCTFRKKSSSIFVVESNQVAEDNKQMSPHASPNSKTHSSLSALYITPLLFIFGCPSLDTFLQANVDLVLRSSGIATIRQNDCPFKQNVLFREIF